MSGSLRRSSTISWVLLLSATLVAGRLGESRYDPRQASLAILALASLKMLLILFDFMELRQGPIAWRGALVAWVAVIVLIGGLNGITAR